MFSEKNIPRWILLTPILTVVLIAVATIYSFVTTQESYFEEESRHIEQEYLARQKQTLRREIASVINYLRHHSDLQRQTLLRYIESIRYGHNGYIWIHDTDYYLRAHPFRPKSINTLDVNLTDAMGTHITQKFVDETLKHPEGVFIEYYWKKPHAAKSSRKIGFFRLYPRYGWVIGTGLYVDDIEQAIAKKKQELERRVEKYIRLVVWIALAVIMIIGLLSLIISRKITSVFARYRQRVTRKEQLLEEMNRNLENRIDDALAEAQEKERALLHQSRLARVGVMLSMIAHQWRQPLSEISAILMELETAAKFGKANPKTIGEAVGDANRLTQFMSHTIDDFRNFFKPDKVKTEFDVVHARDEAIHLANAAIRNAHITLIRNTATGITVLGYEREFSQVILNLLTNAKDILVQRQISEPEITISIRKEKEGVTVSVEDNGGGIEAEEIERIFEPYYTTKSSTKGTGLGLYISKMIIENNMGGELTVTNTSRGARFTIRIGHG